MMREGGSTHTMAPLKLSDGASDLKKYRIADEVFAGVEGYVPPQAGFFLWLPVEDGEEAALKLWTETGVRVLPGAYLARDAGTGNPGKGYIRVALVAPKDETHAALMTIRRTLYD